jgi:hypothetical protein
MLAENPHGVSTRFYNVVVGHLVGIGVSFGVVRVIHMFIDVHLQTHPLVQSLSASVSIILTLVAMFLFRCTHAPAASTTLIIALGLFAPTLYNAAHFMFGVLVIGIAGELLKYPLGAQGSHETVRQSLRP